MNSWCCCIRSVDIADGAGGGIFKRQDSDIRVTVLDLQAGFGKCLDRPRWLSRGKAGCKPGLSTRWLNPGK